MTTFRGRALGAFNDYAARPPARWRKVVAVVMTILLPVELGAKRGVLVGLLAFLVYGGVFAHGTFNHQRTLAWSRRHPAMDASLIIPLTFLGVAFLTSLSLWLCLLIAIAAGGVLIPVALRRRPAREATASPSP